MSSGMKALHGGAEAATYKMAVGGAQGLPRVLRARWIPTIKA